MDPFEESILPFVSPIPDVKCSSSQPTVLFINQNILHVNVTALHEAGYSGLSSVVCSYRYIELLSSDEYKFSQKYYITELKTGNFSSSDFCNIMFSFQPYLITLMELLPNVLEEVRVGLI